MLCFDFMNILLLLFLSECLFFEILLLLDLLFIISFESFCLIICSLCERLKAVSNFSQKIHFIIGFAFDLSILLLEIFSSSFNSISFFILILSFNYYYFNTLMKIYD